MKKLTALCLTFVLAFALSVPAFATSSDTVVNADIIEEHSVEIPADAAQHRIQRHAGLISFIPAAPFICEAILYLFDQLG